MQFSRLAIFGPGLIGGSLLLAVRQRSLCTHCSVWSNVATERDAVQQLGLADTVTDEPARAVAGADLVVLCTPPSSMPGLAGRIAPHLHRGAAVTDVASVKGSLAEELTDIFRLGDGRQSSRYVGSHPMAGGETSGLAAARADLFERCICLLTPLEGQTAPDAVESVTSFWSGLGMSVRAMLPRTHDEAVALSSHLPHLLAAALVRYVDQQPVEASSCVGPGWRDMTRLAGGSPEMWTEILSRNRAPVTNALHGIIGTLCEVLERLESGRDVDIERFLGEAKRSRERLPFPPTGVLPQRN